MPQLAIIADDLTGAADAAALFAATGLATAVPFAEPYPTADVLSISTESRDRSPNEAEEATRAAVERLTAAGTTPSLVYKKIDSALRGHPRRELIATMKALGSRLVVVAPALPGEGRTTLHGHQLVNGVPLEQSSFGRGGPISDLLAVFAAEPGMATVHLDLARLRAAESGSVFTADSTTTRLIVADAETDDDLDAVARAAVAAGVSLLAGSAGLARALVRTAPLTPAVAAPTWRPANGRPVLVIAATQHEATAAQIARAAVAGVTVVRPEQTDLDDEHGTVDPVCAQVEQELARGRNVIVTTAGLRPSPLGSAAVAERLAQVVASRTVRSLVGGMVLTGGDAAAAVCTVLGARAIWLHGEVEPAIPWGSFAGGMLPGLPIVTKAGSFGRPETLLACVRLLGGNAI